MHPVAILPSERPVAIEISVGIATVRIRGAIDTRSLAAVLKALKVRVIVPPTSVRVLVATKPVDFRKGMDGLAALVQEQLRADPFSGVIYVFRAKRADRVKLLFWDQTGLCLLTKRLEGAKFRWPAIAAVQTENTKLAAEHARLELEHTVLAAEVERLTEQNERLDHIIAVLRRAQFGRKSERISTEQMALALEDVETSFGAEDAVVE